MLYTLFINIVQYCLQYNLPKLLTVLLNIVHQYCSSLSNCSILRHIAEYCSKYFMTQDVACIQNRTRDMGRASIVCTVQYRKICYEEYHALSRTLQEMELMQGRHQKNSHSTVVVRRVQSLVQKIASLLNLTGSR